MVSLKLLLLHDAALNVVVEWLILLLRIQEVSGLELGPETGNPD
jgi:hypothetical protein